MTDASFAVGIICAVTIVSSFLLIVIGAWFDRSGE